MPIPQTDWFVSISVSKCVSMPDLEDKKYARVPHRTLFVVPAQAGIQKLDASFVLRIPICTFLGG